MEYHLQSVDVDGNQNPKMLSSSQAPLVGWDQFLYAERREIRKKIKKLKEKNKEKNKKVKGNSSI